MIRKLALLALFCLSASPLTAQDPEPAPSRPTKKPGKIGAAMKWSDERATPIKIKGRSAVYGNEPTIETYTELAAISKDSESFKDKDVKIRGRIIAICPTKGCWLRMKDGENELFVRFKDYSFFVPRHLKDHLIELEGKVKLEIMSEEMRRHYAEEQGKTPEEIEQIKGDERKLNMEAASVTITEPPASKWEDELAKPIAVEKNAAIYGAKITLEQATPVADILSKPEAFDGKNIRIEGNIAKICPKKGCWVTLTSGDQTVQVKFKDYAFFLPRHLAGHLMIAEGVAKKSKLTQDERRHYAEDEGKSQEEIEKIVGDLEVIEFVAAAVKIVEK